MAYWIDWLSTNVMVSSSHVFTNVYFHFHFHELWIVSFIPSRPRAVNSGMWSTCNVWCTCADDSHLDLIGLIPKYVWFIIHKCHTENLVTDEKMNPLVLQRMNYDAWDFVLLRMDLGLKK